MKFRQMKEIKMFIRKKHCLVSTLAFLALGCAASFVQAQEEISSLRLRENTTSTRSAMDFNHSNVSCVESSGCSNCSKCGNRCGKRGLFGWFCRHDCDGDRCYVPPAGTYLSDILNHQIQQGEAALMVLHRFDFMPGDSRLNRHGKRRLSKIVRKLPRNTFPLIVEATPGNESLDKKRRTHVIKVLAEMSAQIPPERVVVDTSPARGLDGVDALSIDDSFSGGSSSVGSSNGGSSSGGSSNSRSAGNGAGVNSQRSK